MNCEICLHLRIREQPNNYIPFDFLLVVATTSMNVRATAVSKRGSIVCVQFCPEHCHRFFFILISLCLIES